MLMIKDCAIEPCTKTPLQPDKQTNSMPYVTPYLEVVSLLSEYFANFFMHVQMLISLMLTVFKGMAFGVDNLRMFWP